MVYLNEVFKTKRYLKKFDVMYSTYNETNPLPKLWIRISDSESESVIPNPRNQSESNSDSRIRGFIINPIPRIRSFWSESDQVVPFEDPDPRIRSGVNDSSLQFTIFGILADRSRDEKLLYPSVHGPDST
ncbi:hypothetical protein AVEN_251063-1 [Araneus ventricosus]|uniref:Uncharacterized protein n=1 Tax=Araneus ventricosus TaxID=182803 RepID=A0A4Y2DMS7_ARAVE|nr:hypothetical protein AVEN_251063-1 [Araneus ventricosus]